MKIPLHWEEDKVENLYDDDIKRSNKKKRQRKIKQERLQRKKKEKQDEWKN